MNKKPQNYKNQRIGMTWGLYGNTKTHVKTQKFAHTYTRAGWHIRNRWQSQNEKMDTMDTRGLIQAGGRTTKHHNITHNRKQWGEIENKNEEKYKTPTRPTQ